MPGSATSRSREIDPKRIQAEEAFLAGDALQGRGSATRDEAIAAAYVASQFAGVGLVPAPGMTGFLQTAPLIKPEPGPPRLTVAGTPIAGATLLSTRATAASGPLAVATGADAAMLPAAPIVLVTARDVSVGRLFGAARKNGIKLLILRETPALVQRVTMNGGRTAAMRVADAPAPAPAPSVLLLPDTAVDALARQAGAAATFTLPDHAEARVATTNAVGYLPGRDPAAGVLLLSAHLDHLGTLADGTIMHGANDDASGTVAVIELARALSHGRRPRRGILFVAYGAEEAGGLGSAWFGRHPPVPTDRLTANLEFEMIGAQDPKLPAGRLMMTGYDRSDFGPTLRRHGALITPDIYPDQHFFQRSDNYQLALTGVVAHTVSGWATVPSYHQPSDTVAAIDIPFMARAIGSLVRPIRWIANAGYRPAWLPGGRPQPDR